MKHALPLFGALALVTGLASPAAAACFADYKAKQDDPLRLHYGIVELPQSSCDLASATDALTARLGDGWQLLQVISVFNDDGLAQRRASAGEFYLRY